VLEPDDNLRKVAIAIAAHPDDIEFMMAGTLLLLNEVGWETHYLNISSGNCGSINLDSTQTETKRLEEAKKAATILGATFHPPFSRDLEIFYDSSHLRKLASVIRLVKPTIVLTHSPQDYMEDHTNTSRLAVTAAFSRGMPNFDVKPPLKPIKNEIALYHAMPHGLMDGMCQPVKPDLVINTTSVFKTKNFDPFKIMVLVFVIVFIFVFSKGIEVLTSPNPYSYSIPYEGSSKSVFEKWLPFSKDK